MSLSSVSSVSELQRLPNIGSITKNIAFSVLYAVVQPVRLFVLFISSFVTKSDTFRSNISYILKTHKENPKEMRNQLMILISSEIKYHYTEAKQLHFLYSMLALPNFENHIEQWLKGATIKFKQGNELLERIENQGIELEKRFSSHEYNNDFCWRVSDSGKRLGEVLIWLDNDDNLLTQLEAHSFGVNILETILHAIDYLRYRAVDYNVGPFGTSPHIERCCPLEYVALRA